MIPQRMTLVTLGVADVAVSRRFYEGLGFRAAGFDSEGVAFFDMNGVVLAVFGREDLAEDANAKLESGSAHARMSLAINLESEAAVEPLLDMGDRTDAAPQLHREAHRVEDGLHGVAIDAAAGEGAVEINHMQVFEPLVLERSGLRGR